MNPELRHFTYFSYRFGCRGKGIGWRLDHCTSTKSFPPSTPLAHSVQVVVSERMLEKVKMCEIRSEIYGASDHCPIVLEIDDTFEATDDAKAEDIVEATDPSAA